MEKSPLRVRAMKCKEQLGISYKKMYETIGVGRSTFYNFIEGVGKLREEYSEKLDQFLKNMGY